MLNGIADSYCLAEGATSCGQVCTSGDMARRGKEIKRVPRNSSVSSLSNVRSLYGRSGKENNHSIWQRVQRNDTDVGVKEDPLLKKNRNVAQSSKLSTYEDKNQSKVKASRKLKTKTIPGSKQEFSYYSRKGSYATKASSNVCMKIKMQQNELLDIPGQIGGQKGLNSVSQSHSKNGYRRIESITSEPDHSLEVCTNELEPLEPACATLLTLNDQTVNRESCSLSSFCDYRDQTGQIEGHSTVFLRPPGAEEGTKIDKDISPVEQRKQDHSSGPILQKWIPVGMKDSVLTRLGHSNSLSMANLDKPAAEICTSENTEKEMYSYPDILASSVSGSLMCTVPGSRDDNGLLSEDDGQIEKCRSQRTYTPNASCINHGPRKWLSCDPKDQNNSTIENDSNKITQAVNDAYKAQLASEAVQMATGGPIAEFERLLYSVSPVIPLSRNIFSCLTCLPDEVVGAPLCRHETPSISLRSVWQWYEKHGTYGLEVRAEDYENSKRLGMDCFSFHAYFVPFLSAVQLFRKRKSHPPDSSDRVLGTEAVEEFKLDERSENSSNIGCLPILSVLVPLPRIEDTSSLSPRNCMYCSETSSVCTKGNTTIQLGDSTCSDDLELLFEYFEVEQPQQRRSLFERIKELVRGDGTSQCRAYGDPTKLDSVGLNDLHPKSWYSVAWYPIYRIPDGNFRAAFLTYHCLGHYVHRSVTSDSFSVDACVVSPVVGLQSYNAQN